MKWHVIALAAASAAGTLALAEDTNVNRSGRDTSVGSSAIFNAPGSGTATGGTNTAAGSTAGTTNTNRSGVIVPNPQIAKPNVNGTIVTGTGATTNPTGTGSITTPDGVTVTTGAGTGTTSSPGNATLSAPSTPVLSAPGTVLQQNPSTGGKIPDQPAIPGNLQAVPAGSNLSGGDTLLNNGNGTTGGTNVTGGTSTVTGGTNTTGTTGGTNTGGGLVTGNGGDVAGTNQDDTLLNGVRDANSGDAMRRFRDPGRTVEMQPFGRTNPSNSIDRSGGPGRTGTGGVSGGAGVTGGVPGGVSGGAPGGNAGGAAGGR